MTVVLAKGGNVSLSKAAPSMTHAVIALGWDARATDGVDFDLDASVFMLGDNGKVLSEEDFIFYRNLESKCKSIIHKGDNITGKGEGEKIFIDFNKIPQHITKLAFTVTIHDAIARSQNFGMVSNAYIRIVDQNNNIEVLRFDLTEDASTETAMVFAEIYRYNNEWKFKAVGQGYSGGLKALCAQYGISATE